MAIIYKLIIGDYHYIGRTILRFSTRYNAHKKSCFNRSKKSYWTKLYVKIRELGVKKSAWEDKVKYKIIYKNCADEEIDFYEMSCININHPWNLNTMSKEITEFYTRPLVKWGTYNTPELKKAYQKEYKQTENGKDANKKYGKKYRQSDKGKVSVKKSNDKHNPINNKKYNPINNAKRYFCECCNQEMANRTKYRHNKTIKHSTNKLEWIE